MVAKMHAHVEMPTENELGRIIDAKFPAHRELYLALHALVVESVPDVRYSLDCVDAAIGYAQRQLGYDGWGMAAVAPHAGWVSLLFLRGTRLRDEAGLLEGSGALVRHVKIRSLEEFRAKSTDLKNLVVEASQLNGH